MLRGRFPRGLFTIVAACAALSAQSGKLKQGIALYENEEYLKAATAFEDALRDDPKSVELNLYVGTAYSREVHEHYYSKGAPAAAQKAAAAFRRALELAPDDLTALASLGSLAYVQVFTLDPGDPRRTAGLAEAKNTFKRVMSLAPRDSLTIAFVAALDAEIARDIRRMVYAKAGLSPYYADHPIGNAAVRAELQARAAPLYDESIELFRGALAIEPKFPDAMMGLWQMLSLKADLLATAAEYRRQAGDPAMPDKALSLARSGTPVAPAPSFKRIAIRPAIVLPSVAPPPPPPPGK